MAVFTSGVLSNQTSFFYVIFLSKTPLGRIPMLKDAAVKIVGNSGV